MRTAHKITLSTIGIIFGIVAAITTIIKNTVDIVAKATPSEVPEDAVITKGIAGNANIQYENIQQKPMRGK